MKAEIDIRTNGLRFWVLIPTIIVEYQKIMIAINWKATIISFHFLNITIFLIFKSLNNEYRK